MKNFSINTFFCILLSSITGICGENALIAFNGGASSNKSYYEEYIKFFQNRYFQKSTTILNANGINSKVIPWDEYGQVDRDYFGNVKLQSTIIPNSIVASNQNLQATVKNVSEKKPQSVTLFFTDHGSPDGIAAWNESIPYESAHKLDQDFNPNTTVRRIHFHCYAGAALSNRKSDTSKDLISKYPKNRCAFAASKEDEVAYSFNFKDVDELHLKSHWMS